VRDTIDYEMAVLNNLPKNKHRDFVSSRYLSKDISADVDSPNTMSRYLLSLMIALRS
jgi:hypothetical protein